MDYLVIMMMILFSFLNISEALPPVSESTIQSNIASFNKSAHFPIPNLSASQISDLQNGEVVTILDASGGADQPRRAVGYMLSEVPQKQLWVACQDPHAVLQSSTKELKTKVNPDHSAHWYGFFDIPWPFSDRHWMVKSWNTQKVADSSNNQYWEHPWDLLPDGAAQIKPFIEAGKLPGVTMDLVEEAIYTPVSKGAWVMMDVQSDLRLVVYHATTVVGGSIPEDAAVRYTVTTLEDMMRGMEKRAIEWVPTHYVGNHVGVLGGDNKIVEKF
jgi:hypothetical protein